MTAVARRMVGRGARHEAVRTRRRRAAYGTARIALLHLRTSRGMLLAWPLVLAGVVTATAASIASLYPTLPDRLAYAASMTASPATAAFNGRWADLTTVGGITTNEVGFMGLLLIPVMGVLLAVGLSRREEDAGRTELVTSGTVGRLAPLLGAAAVAAASCLLMGLLSLAGLLVAGLPAAGSTLYAALLTAYGLCWVGVGLLAAEVASGTRTAVGLGLGAAFAVFVARAAVDASGTDAPWLTPMSWLPEAQPYGARRVWPVLALVAVGLFAAAGAARMSQRRDLGGGLVAERSGPAVAGRSLGSATGLAWRRARGSVVAWLTGLVVWGAALGTLADDMTQVVNSNPQLLAALGVDRGEDLVTALAAALSALAACALEVQVAGRLGTEEESGRLGLLLSTRLTRVRVWGGFASVALAGGLAALAVHAVALGLGAQVATGDTETLGTALGAAAALSVPVLAVGALAFAARALVPRVAAVVWALVGWGALVTFLGETLDLPTWARRLSPVEAVGRVPIEDPSATALLVLSVTTVALLELAQLAVRRRDLLAG